MPCFVARLFTTVRDSMGLTYDVSFELNLFDKLDLGWYVIAVTSTPSKVSYLVLQNSDILYASFDYISYHLYCQVHKAVDACKGVLRGLHSSRIVERELDRVSQTLQVFSILLVHMTVTEPVCVGLWCLCIYSVNQHDKITFTLIYSSVNILFVEYAS